MIRQLYDWVLQWAEKPHALVALLILSFAESSFFPVPPDVLLIPLVLARPKRAWFLALVCTLTSVLGGLLGYVIGWAFMESAGQAIVRFYGVQNSFASVQAAYHEYAGWAVFTAGFTPIPYKVFTIAAGACSIRIPIFILASLAGRGGRFFLLSFLVWKFGQPVRTFIDRYFNVLSIAFVVLLVAGFALLKLFH